MLSRLEGFTSVLLLERMLLAQNVAWATLEGHRTGVYNPVKIHNSAQPYHRPESLTHLLDVNVQALPSSASRPPRSLPALSSSQGGKRRSDAISRGPSLVRRGVQCTFTCAYASACVRRASLAPRHLNSYIDVKRKRALPSISLRLFITAFQPSGLCLAGNGIALHLFISLAVPDFCSFGVVPAGSVCLCWLR